VYPESQNKQPGYDPPPRTRNGRQSDGERRRKLGWSCPGKSEVCKSQRRTTPFQHRGRELRTEATGTPRLSTSWCLFHVCKGRSRRCEHSQALYPGLGTALRKNEAADRVRDFRRGGGWVSGDEARGGQTPTPPDGLTEIQSLRWSVHGDAGRSAPGTLPLSLIRGLVGQRSDVAAGRSLALALARPFIPMRSSRFETNFAGRRALFWGYLLHEIRCRNYFYRELLVPR